MRSALPFIGIACFIGATVACVGGGGPLPDPSGQGEETNPGTGDDNQPTPTTTDSGSTNSPPSPITASSYNASCTQNSDCAAIFEGDVCSNCRCPNASINTQDVPKYSTDVATAIKSCASSTANTCKCTAPQVRCNTTAKRCEVGPPNELDAGG